MEQSKKVSLFYGYSVCLIAIICFLLSLTMFIQAWYDLSDPIHATHTSDDLKLDSFQNYQANLQQKTDFYLYKRLTSEDGGWKMYQAAYNARVASISHEAKRTQLISGVIGGLCLVLFLTHISWLCKVKA